MMVLNPVMQEHKWYINCLCPFFPFAQWTPWRTILLHRLCSRNLYWIRSDRIMEFVFKSEKFFFYSSCAKFHLQSSGRTEDFKQAHRQTLVLDSDQIPLIFLLHFSFHILKFLPIYCCAVVQTLSKMHQHEFPWFGRNVSQHQISCTLLCIISLLRAVHTSSGYVDLFYAHCTDLMTVCSWACNELEVPWRKWYLHSKNCCNEIQNDRTSACYLKWEIFGLKQLCSWMEILCSCVDLRNSNLLSASLSVRRP
jgi:hypothetical protein